MSGEARVAVMTAELGLAAVCRNPRRTWHASSSSHNPGGLWRPSEGSWSVGRTWVSWGESVSTSIATSTPGAPCCGAALRAAGSTGRNYSGRHLWHRWEGETPHAHTEGNRGFSAMPVCKAARDSWQMRRGPRWRAAQKALHKRHGLPLLPSTVSGLRCLFARWRQPCWVEARTSESLDARPRPPVADVLRPACARPHRPDAARRLPRGGLKVRASH